jgi:predicted NBD/HSP70 family sugar kinase
MHLGSPRFTRASAAPQNPPMPGNRISPGRRAPRRILVIDVGGTRVKFRIEPRGREVKFASGSRLGPERMVRKVLKRARGHAFDAVSIGYPGLVVHGRIAAEPHNLGQGWLGFDFPAAFGKPVRIVNDAAMQAIGSYRGGRMLFLGLGTGLGATLIIDGIVEPMEIGHMPYRKGRSFEGYVGEQARQRLGTRKWRAVVGDVIAQLRKALEPDYLVLGGGNAARQKKLPPGVRRGNNRNAFIGGLRLWRRSAVRPRPALVAAARA